MQLCRMLTSIQQDATPPLQTMTHIMASLPTNVGGTRTIAIAVTLYRLLMQLDHETTAQFEKDTACIEYSAKSGASAFSAAEDRALEAELAQIRNTNTLFFV